MKNRLLVPLLVLLVAFGFQSYMIQRYHGLLARSLKEEGELMTKLKESTANLNNSLNTCSGELSKETKTMEAARKQLRKDSDNTMRGFGIMILVPQAPPIAAPEKSKDKSSS